VGLEVRVLGPLVVLLDGRRLLLRGGRLGVLLAALAVAGGRVVSVEALGVAVWGRGLPANPRNSLQIYVGRLRRLLGDDAIVTRPGGYLLRVGVEQVDALRFLRLVAVARGGERERDGLVEALRLWRGVPFEGIESEWLSRSEGERLTEAYLDALERVADLDLTAGRAGELLGQLRVASERYPLREPLCVRLMLALDATGRRAEALAHYEVFRARLADELGTDPGSRPRRVYEGLVGSVAARAGEVPRQLPSDISRFTGRSDVLDALTALTAVGEAAGGTVGVLHGTGGVGKTAVVVHWAHRAESLFPDGQLFVNLQGYGPGAPVTPAVALDGLLRALGVEGRKIPDSVEGRGVLLRELLAGRRVLLVLDNVRDADQVRPLLPGGRTLAVVTSRSRLRKLSADQTVRRIPVDEFSGVEAVEFLAAAMHGQEAAHDVQELEELAALCGRLPLALAVAAEQAGRHPRQKLEQLITELRDQHDRLETLEVADDPMSSVRTVFSWSLGSLAEDCVHGFQLLGLHPGPDLDAPAAAALIGTTTTQARRLLAQLVDAHLLEQRRPGRYQFHDLLRAYAAELANNLDTTHRDNALERMFSWYVHTAANARTAIGRGESLTQTSPLPTGITPLAFTDERTAFTWLDGHRPGLIATVERAAQTNHHAAHQLAEQIATYLFTRFAVNDLERVEQIALEVAQHTSDEVAEAVATNRLGWVSRMTGDYQRARDLQEQALAQFNALGNDRGKVAAMTDLGGVLELDDEYRALDYEEQALRLARRIGDNDQIIKLLNNLAMSYLRMQRYADAVDACRQALAMQPSRAFRNFEPHLWDSLGQALAASGRFDEAIETLGKSLAKVLELGDHWGESIVLSNLGAAFRDAGRPDEAAASWRRALSLMNEHAIADGQEVSRGVLEESLRALGEQSEGPTPSGSPSPET
jgi:DNA-binding SARP family transcriptional activator/tetratricopeptide (TPR) repeat protein